MFGTVWLWRVLQTLPAGQALAIRGPSGAGKSTLLMVMAGLIRPRSGSVAWGATDLAQLTDAPRGRFRRRHFGLIFQDFQLLSEAQGGERSALRSNETNLSLPISRRE